MVLTEQIIGYRMPEKVLVAGKRFLELYRRDRNGAGLLKRLDNGYINSENLKEIFRSTGDGDAGILLTGENFIYNLLEFDKLPLRSVQREEMVQWRLSKVFPGDISAYDHQVIKLSKKLVLSVLLPVSKKKEIAEAFEAAGIKEIYIGNSFIELGNSFSKRDKRGIILEMGEDYCMVGFGSHLQYIRKLIIPGSGALAGELNKTITYIRKLFGAGITEVYMLDNSRGSSGIVSDYFRKEHSLEPLLIGRDQFVGGLK